MMKPPINSPLITALYYRYKIKRLWPKAAQAASLTTYSTPKISTPQPLTAHSFKFQVYLGRSQKTTRDLEYKLEHIIASLRAHSATIHSNTPTHATITLYYSPPEIHHTLTTTQQLVQQSSANPRQKAPGNSLQAVQPQPPTGTLDSDPPQPNRKPISQGITFLYQLFDSPTQHATPAYIGITTNLKRRLKEHEDEWPQKEWLSIDPTLTTSQKFLTRREAEREESRLIRLHSPKYNTKGR